MCGGGRSELPLSWEEKKFVHFLKTDFIRPRTECVSNILAISRHYFEGEVANLSFLPRGRVSPPPPSGPPTAQKGPHFINIRRPAVKSEKGEKAASQGRRHQGQQQHAHVWAFGVCPGRHQINCPASTTVRSPEMIETKAANQGRFMISGGERRS